MNKYIFFTCNIAPVGGLQLYVSGKTEYLERTGWDVNVFYYSIHQKKCAYKNLNKYSSNGYPELLIPPADLPSSIRIKTIDSIVKKIGGGNGKIYVESNDDLSALWGELIAKKIHGIHINFNCNEQFRGPNKYYVDYINFFKEKFDNAQLFGLRPDTQAHIFSGYYNVKRNNRYMFDAVEPQPIQKVHNEIIDEIYKKDFNIMYLGRVSKGYVPNIISGVVKFAEKHNDKTVQLIVVGNPSERKTEIEKQIRKQTNLSVFYTGDLVPIPANLYDKVDAVVAGAVCAEISALMNVPTIVMDCEKYSAIGLLGYTVFNSMYEEDGKSYPLCDLLEDALVSKNYCSKNFNFPERESSDDIYYSQLPFFAEITNPYQYYNVESQKSFHKNMVLKYYTYKIFEKYPKIEHFMRNIKQKTNK